MNSFIIKEIKGALKWYITWITAIQFLIRIHSTIHIILHSLFLTECSMLVGFYYIFRKAETLGVKEMRAVTQNENSLLYKRFCWFCTSLFSTLFFRCIQTYIYNMCYRNKLFSIQLSYKYIKELHLCFSFCHHSACINSWRDVSTSPSNSETFRRDCPSVAVYTVHRLQI